MNWYKRHIGDYAKKAAKLSILQHGAYTVLLDACYDKETFPQSEDEAIDMCWASSPEEKAAVIFVFNKFFKRVDGLYVQSRVNEELIKYRKTCDANARIATDREQNRTKRAQNVNEACTERERSVHDKSTNRHLTKNQEPRTNNQEPETTTAREPRFDPAMALKNLGVDERTAADWLQLRKTKRAVVTQTAIAGVVTEAAAAGWQLTDVLKYCCQKGWVGFEARWVATTANKSQFCGTGIDKLKSLRISKNPDENPEENYDNARVG